MSTRKRPQEGLPAASSFRNHDIARLAACNIHTVRTQAKNMLHPKGSGGIVSYAPFRRALLEHVMAPGSGPAFMKNRFGELPYSSGLKTIMDNCDEWWAWSEAALKDIRLVKETWVADGRHFDPIPFDAVLMKGGFHALVEHRRRGEVLLYVRTTTDLNPVEWSYLKETLRHFGTHRHGFSGDKMLLIDPIQEAVEWLGDSRPKHHAGLVHAVRTYLVNPSTS